MFGSKLDFRYYDLDRNNTSRDIDLLFPDWSSNETVVVFSPHDDDTLLGAGYGVLAALSEGAEVYIFIFCNGCAGYSDTKEKQTIVEIRSEESKKAYANIGIEEDHIVRFGYPDFSVFPHLGWQLPGGLEGTFAKTLPKLREVKVTRLLVPNGYREHLDHATVNQIGAYDGPQVGDPILADWGKASPIKSYLEYAVWGDFSPQDSLISDRRRDLRGNRIIVTNSDMEEKIQTSLKCFESQQDIIKDLINHRKRRRLREGYLEIYLGFDPRPRLDYEPYIEYLQKFG